MGRAPRYSIKNWRAASCPKPPFCLRRFTWQTSWAEHGHRAVRAPAPPRHAAASGKRTNWPRATCPNCRKGGCGLPLASLVTGLAAVCPQRRKIGTGREGPFLRYRRKT